MVDRPLAHLPSMSPIRARILAIRNELDSLLAECDAPIEPAVAPKAYETPEEYALREDVDPDTVYRWIKAGMPHRKVGRYLRIDVQAAAAWHAGGGIRSAVKQSAKQSARRTG